MQTVSFTRVFACAMGCALAVVLAAPLAGQGGGGQAPAPAMPPKPLPDAPFVIDSAEAGQVRVSVMKGLAHPWSLAFLPNGDILITERPGRLRIVRKGVLDPQPLHVGEGRKAGSVGESPLEGAFRKA